MQPVEGIDKDISEDNVDEAKVEDEVAADEDWREWNCGRGKARKSWNALESRLGFDSFAGFDGEETEFEDTARYSEVCFDGAGTTEAVSTSIAG